MEWASAIRDSPPWRCTIAPACRPTGATCLNASKGRSRCSCRRLGPVARKEAAAADRAKAKDKVSVDLAAGAKVKAADVGAADKVRERDRDGGDRAAVEACSEV